MRLVISSKYIVNKQITKPVIIIPIETTTKLELTEKYLDNSFMNIK